jgi:hypothetical protein
MRSRISLGLPIYFDVEARAFDFKAMTAVIVVVTVAIVSVAVVHVEMVAAVDAPTAAKTVIANSAAKTVGIGGR